MLDVISIEEPLYWDEIVMSFKDYDIYYLSGYVKSFQCHGDGIPLLLYYHSYRLRGICVFMKRDVASLPFYKDILQPGQYFDLVTPYGYGGFIFEGDVNEDTCSIFRERFTRVLEEQQIVSLFVRFHPQLKNVENSRFFCDTCDLGKTIELDIESQEIIWGNLTCKNRNVIRKAEKLGVCIQHGRGEKLLSVFKDIYNSTMEKDQANAYYYFEDQFYKSINEDLQDNYEIFYALYKEKIISMAIILFVNRRMHYHLSGSLEEYKTLAASNFLLYKAACWGCEQGFKKFHLGGGLGAKEDGLFKFKQAFSRKSDCTFSIGKQVVNVDAYTFLVKTREKNDKCFGANLSFFPLYRS